MTFVQAVANFYRRYSEAVVGVSDFLRDDLPADAPGMGKFAQEVGRRACRQYARNRENFGIIAYDPIWSDSCNPYLDSINEGPTTEGNYSPPFSGGQCSGKIYGTSLSGTICYRPAPTLQNPNPDIICVPLSETRACGTSGAIIGPVRLVQNEFSDGATRTYFIGQGPNRGAELSITAGPAQEARITVNSSLVTLCPNQGADDCGDPDNEYEPPRYPPNLPPLPPPTNPGPGFGDNWDVEINPDGTFEICIDGECSDPIPPGPGDSPPGDPSEDPGEEDGDPQENDPNNPQDGDITGCASDGQILTGIKIEINRIPVGENPGSGGFYRNVCWVWMGPSQDQLDLVTDGRFLESGQFVIPDSNNCRCYRVRPSPLWGLSVQAYSRPEKED